MSVCANLLYLSSCYFINVQEYPSARGGKPEDKENFAALTRELRQAFNPHGFLLTAAVSAGKWFIDPGYDVPEISRYVLQCHEGAWFYLSVCLTHGPLSLSPQKPGLHQRDVLRLSRRLGRQNRTQCPHVRSTGRNGH